MYKLTTICLVLVGHMSMAVPVDDPSSKLAPSTVLLEKLSSLGPSSAVESSSPDLAPSAVIEENPSILEPKDMLIESSYLDEPSSDLSHFFESRIIGGTDAPPHHSPFMVALVVGWQWKSLSCGGSIIGIRFILTAAHCIHKDWQGNLLDTYHGVVGTNNWNKGGEIIRLKSQKTHPKYNFATIKYDCALIQTENDFKFGKTISPIRLEQKWVGGNVPSFVTGWGTQVLWGGAPEKLQILYVGTISGKQCEKLLSESSNMWTPPMDYKLEICTYHSPGFGMCHGDSGSALTSVLNGRQIGIVSWGQPCAIGAPDMFVRIGAMLPFIDDCIRNPHW